MGFTAGVVFASLFLGLSIVGIGAFTGKRSLTVLVAGLLLMCVSGLGAYYSILETQSIAWGVGYAFIGTSVGVATLINWLPAKQNMPRV